MHPRPTLRRRMIVSIALMLLGVLTVGIGAIIAVNGLRADLGQSVQGYRQLRQLFDVGFLASKAREAITANPPQPRVAIAALQAAATSLEARSDANTVEGPPDRWLIESDRDDCRRLISQSIYELDHGSNNAPSLNLLFGRMSKVSDEVRTTISAVQTAADHKRQVSLSSIVGLCVFVVIAAISIGIRQYRRVIGPLRIIGDGARTIAAGQFQKRIPVAGDREFATLAGDFNQMAAELSALYRDLEEKVAAKSKELVQSERLASVGYLAAGVAHEINNPLGIIAGYAERAAELLEDGSDVDVLPRTKKALAVINEEAFRCKQIIDRLLSLARPTSNERKVIAATAVAQEVISTLSGLGTVGDRSLSLDARADADLSIMADEGEFKQVLLNLIINSLEAVDAATGHVRVTISRQGDDVQLSIADNGHGMTRATLDQIFQPFFTDKRGRRPGTGLGLSIVHAIVTSHGARISAQSDGVGRGSTFIITWPAARGDAHASA